MVKQKLAKERAKSKIEQRELRAKLEQDEKDLKVYSGYIAHINLIDHSYIQCTSRRDEMGVNVMSTCREPSSFRQS
jgi:hypothetical protein